VHGFALELHGPGCQRRAVSLGPLLCLASAVAFGAMAIFGKHAYDAGVTVPDLLLVRFALAAAVLLAVASATGALRTLPRRAVLAALAMGVVGYAAQSALFFSALQRLDASLVALLLYTYPAFVLLGAIAVGRERATGRRVAALLVALAGTVLVLGVAVTGRVDGPGVALGVGAAVVYSTYILVGDRVVAGVAPLALSALVCTGATATFAGVAVARGGTDLAAAPPAGWLWMSAIALVSTVGAIVTFFGGLARVGPGAASILSMLEPVVTVALPAEPR
jgi:drug/metabolite transporter (DMT)-like permease